MPTILKVPAEVWVKAARQALITDGIGGVKIERISKQLNVSRGGFYHHFRDRMDLLNRLLNDWTLHNKFLPKPERELTKSTVPEYLVALIDHHITEESFSPAYEMAVREWGRIDNDVRAHIDQIDDERISKLSDIFGIVGYDDIEADVRARVLYLHQMGYYSLNLHNSESKEDRLKVASTYMQILCGSKVQAAELWPSNP